MGERLTEQEVNAKAGWGHKVRYHLASSYLGDRDVVLDAACGIGYGSYILKRSGCMGPGVIVHRVDQLPVEERLFYEFKNYNIEDHVADLNSWEPDFEFDAAVSYETIEHVENYQHLLKQLKKAKKWIFCSVPVVPTVHLNEYHLHDFAPLELPGYVEDEDWELYQYLAQPQELSEIYIFKRRDFNG
jgi:SAM-dependent methyltransferase